MLSSLKESYIKEDDEADKDHDENLVLKVTNYFLLIMCLSIWINLNLQISLFIRVILSKCVWSLNIEKIYTQKQNLYLRSIKFCLKTIVGKENLLKKKR